MAMHIIKWLALMSTSALVVSASRNKQFQDSIAKRQPSYLKEQATPDALLWRAEPDATPKKSPYLNSRSRPFAVDGRSIPEVNFDAGESYAGLLPISKQQGETRKLFFWFFPSDEPKASEEIVIWLNGGPGCSSLDGLLTENGPFLWQDGTFAPVKNPYSWSRLSNVVWIEQPVGTGFSQGTPNITNEIELAEQFKGFWKNFVDTFGLQRRRVYLSGESYAGMYVPYIANSFLLANDTKYFNVKGIAINDPVIGDSQIQGDLPMLPFLGFWSRILGLDQVTLDSLQKLNKDSGYADYMEKYFQFPPPSHTWPAPPPNSPDLDSAAYYAVVDVNPCFNLYHISDMCPDTYSELGVLNGHGYNPKGAVVYFQRPEVQKAIHAHVGTNWTQCTNPVFVDGKDSSPGPAIDGTLESIIRKTGNVIIGSGALDILLPTNGTLFALQNMTWGGVQGFQNYPSTPFLVPPHNITFQGFKGGSGNLGVWIEERGLIFYEITLAGHQLPGYAPSAGYRVLQKLLGRVPDFSSIAPLFG